jgi:hypothetical protein
MDRLSGKFVQPAVGTANLTVLFERIGCPPRHHRFIPYSISPPSDFYMIFFRDFVGYVMISTCCFLSSSTPCPTLGMQRGTMTLS